MKGKRILSAVLSAALLLQLSPLVAFAEDTTPLPDTISTVQSEPAPELLAEPTPEPTVEPATALPPEPEAEPTATPTPNPTAEPTATPAAETPAPDATAEPTPEPTVEPTATPDAAEQVQALIDALPDADAVTEDTADAVEEQLAAIDDAKDTLTDEQLAGLDFARYDAAANALLALWGEAPADAVELLDTYATPQKGSDDYYQIASVNDLYWLATPAAKNVKAKLTKDITVNNKVLNDDGSLISDPSSLKAWTPINDFAGTLDGQGHTISGLYCNTPDSEYVGLFGSIKGGGEVRHLGVVDSYFAGSGFVGGVCGRNDGTISGCYSTATVSSTLYTGGVLVGFTDGIVKNSFAYGTALNRARSLGSFQGGNTTNCFYLSHSAVAVEYYGNGVTEATAEKFQSGEVAYLLGLQDSIWKQALNSDRYPSFTGQSVGYANDTYHNHDNAENCEICKVADSKPNQSGGVYQITTAAELKWFAATVNSGKSLISAILLKDIMVDSWTPIGTQDNAFTGTLNGNGRTVTINGMASTDYAGLVGCLGANGKITNIKVAGNVTGGNNVGGVVGYCLGKLENVINTATVSGTSNVGGVIGYYGATGNASYNLGNTGDVSGDDFTSGGVIGKNDSSLCLYNSYSTTKRLCGQSSAKSSYENCFDTSGTSAIKPKDPAAFKSGEVAYLLHNGRYGSTWGQNLDTETAPNCLPNSPQVFQNADKKGYHNHTGETCDKCPTVPPQVEGVYQISTEQQLRDYARIVGQSSSDFTASAVLTANITVSDAWTPIECTTFQSWFQGTFDGQGHSITFLQPVTASDCAGLFAKTGSSAVIQNLTVRGEFSGYYAGGIVGANSGTITNCTLQDSTVTYTGSDTNATTGGLVGRNYRTGTIQSSQVVSSTVSGVSVDTGGLAGLNDRGTIQNCRVVSVNITPGESAGGLAGRNSAGVIKDSYAAVDLPVAAGNYNGGTITNCYRLGQTASVDGGETTATEQQFHSGEVAYKLAAGSKSSTPQWGQTIAPDSYPVLGGDPVYCAEDYYHNHTGSSCAVCDDKPAKNAHVP